MDLSAIWNATQDLAARVLNLEGSTTSLSGWTPDGATWVYVSATSFKIVGVDVTARFPVGAKLRLKQGAGYLYFYVISAAFGSDTTVTITGGIDYTLANATITDNYYSYADHAQGFPGGFAFTPAFFSTAATFTYTTQVGRFSIRGATLHFDLYIKETNAPGGTTSNSLYIIIPVYSVNIANLNAGCAIYVSFITLDAGFGGFQANIGTNTNLISLVEWKTGASEAIIKAVNLLASGAFVISGDYHIA